MTVTTDRDEPNATSGSEDVVAAGTGGTTHPNGAGRGRSPSRIVLVVVCVVALVAQAIVTVQLVNARNTRSELDDQIVQRDQQLADLNTELASTRERLQAMRIDEVGRRNENDAVTGSLGIRQIEITELTNDVARMQEKTKALQDAIGRASEVDKEQVRQLLLLTKCLNGIKQANFAAAAGRPNDTVAALKAVSDICQQTLEIMSPGSTANFPFDFADPSVIYAGGKYYAYATNGGGGRVQVISSTDLIKWEWVGEALSRLPGWAVPGNTWAPSVMSRGDTFYLYYTARHAASRRQCISVATSKSPAGPFVDDSAGPFVCQLDRAGSIDPSPFIASDGTFYLLWKSEGEVIGVGARLAIGKLNEDLKGLDGDPVDLVGVDRRWEGRTVEAPSMVEANGRFYLLYSGNRWDTADYASGYAICEKPMGPCSKPADNVFLMKHDKLAGPGGTEVFIAPGGQTFVSYHAWTDPNIGYPNKRQLHVEKLSLSSGRPVLS